MAPTGGGAGEEGQGLLTRSKDDVPDPVGSEERSLCL